MKSISAFFPAYNDEKSIPVLVNNIIPILEKYTSNYEIIVVDDCSPDNVGVIADEMARNNPKIKVIHHKNNRGYGGALKSGFKSATKDLIFYTDGDGQYDVREIEKLLRYVEDQEVDVVNGYKIKRSDNIARKLAGKSYHFLVKILFNLKIKDVDCDFRLFKRKVIDAIDLVSDSGSITVELVKKSQKKGFRFKEVEVNHYPRIDGKSQFFKFSRILKTLRDLGKLWIQIFILRK